MIDDLQLRERINGASQRISGMGSPLELAKLSTSFYDRLIVINGAALTVSLSAIGNHHTSYGTNLSILGQRSLEVAWISFIASIILAVVTNWFYVSDYSTMEVFLEAKKSLNEIEDLLRTREASPIGKPTFDVEAEYTMKRLRHFSNGQSMGIKSRVTRRRWTGGVAQAAATSGFTAMGVFLFSTLVQ